MVQEVVQCWCEYNGEHKQAETAMSRTMFLMLLLFAFMTLPGCSQQNTQPGCVPSQESFAAAHSLEEPTLPSGIRPVRSLWRTPTYDAIYERLGDPDRITGSGRTFLHYDLKNGKTITIILGGDNIIGVELSPEYRPSSQPTTATDR